jgi:hypothetical protein
MFRLKLTKIAQNRDHNIVPWSRYLRSIYTVRQIVLYDTIFTGSINPIFVVRHFQMSYETIFPSICRIQGCQIFLDTKYQNVGIYTKLPRNYQITMTYTKWPYYIPNGHKMYQHFPF